MATCRDATSKWKLYLPKSTILMLLSRSSSWAVTPMSLIKYLHYNYFTSRTLNGSSSLCLSSFCISSGRSALAVLKTLHIPLLYSLLCFNSSLIWPTNREGYQTMKRGCRLFPHWCLYKFNSWKARKMKMGEVGSREKEISNLTA